MRGIHRTRVLLILAAVALCAYAAQTASAQSKDPIKWKFFAFTGAVHPITKYFQAFAEDVKQKTDGRLEITVYPGGELPYKAFDVLKIVGQRQVELGDGYGGFIGGDMPVLGVFSLPFLITSNEGTRIAVEAARDILDEQLGKRDVQILYLSYWPPQTIWSVKPLSSLEDLKGRKMRGKGREENAFFAKFDAIPVTLSLAEVPTAIQRNVVDGVVTAAFNIIGAGWTDLLKAGYLIELHHPFDFILMNRSAFNELPKDIQQMVLETAALHQKKMSVEVPVTLENEAREKLRNMGYTINDSSDAEMIEAQKRMSSYWEEWAEKSGAGAQEALSKIRKALGK